MRILKISALILAVLLAVVSGLLPARAQQSPPKPTGHTEQAQAPNQPAPAAANPVKPPADKVIISVGDEKITVGEFDEMLAVLPPQFRAYYSGSGRKYLPQYLVQMKVLALEAIRRNLQDTPKVQMAVKIARESILANAAREEIEKSFAISDQQLEAMYQSRKADYEEAHIRRILIQTTKTVLGSGRTSHAPLPPEEAQKKLEDLRRQILAGADFAEMAKKYSYDQASAAAGGDMGFISRQGVVPPIAEAAFSLKPGEVSDVIPTPYGLELIKVEGRRTRPFADAKVALTEQLRQSEFQKAYEELVKKDNVQVDTEFFTPPPTQPKPSPAPSN